MQLYRNRALVVVVGLVSHLVLQSEGAIIGRYTSSDCSNYQDRFVFYEGICTSNQGYATSLSSCENNYLKAWVYEDSKNPPAPKSAYEVPSCNAGGQKYIEAKNTCSPSGTSGIYTKIIDNTCTAPTNTYLAYITTSSCIFAVLGGQAYETIIADGVCRVWPGPLNLYYSAYVVTNGISLTTYTSYTCSTASKDAVWLSTATTGVCFAPTTAGKVWFSLSLSKPLKYDPNAGAASLAAALIVIIVIGSLVGCCAGILSIFHCMGCINIPCFNQCCDRRKTVVTSSAPPPVVVQNVVNSTPPQGYSSGGGGGGGGQKHSFAQPSYPSQYPSSQSQYSSGHSPYPGGAQSVQSPYPSAQSHYAGGAYAQQPQPSYAQQPQPSYAQQPQSTYPQQPTSYGQQPTYPQQQPQYGQQQPQYGQQAQRRSSDPYGGMRL